MKIEDIKNHTFKKNIIDTEENKIVSSIYLNSNKRIDNSEFYTKNCKHLIWKYYKDRNKINVNDINSFSIGEYIIEFSSNDFRASKKICIIK